MTSLLMLIALPFAFGIGSLGFKRLNRLVALGLSLVPLILLLLGQETEVNYSWIPSLSIDFSLKVDGVSRLFLYLTGLIIPFAIWAASEEEWSGKSFSALFLLQGLLFGFFLANDLVLFTLFWEAILLPLFFLLLNYGGGERRGAAVRFLVYMLAGSCLLIIAILSLYLTTQTFALDELAAKAGNYSSWIFAIFLLAFAVKTPLFPFHGWLPDAYAQATTTGTILLSALLSKAGIYGIYRICLGLFPNLMAEYSLPLASLAIIGVLYGGFSAWAQNDYKRLIAYSSFSHVNFILAGVFALNAVVHQGALVQVFNHGVTITALFYICSYLYERIGSMELSGGGGLTALFPRLGWTALFIVLAAIALPGTGNFVGEVLILFGLFSQSPWLAALLGLSLILGAAYMLRFYHRLFFGEINTLFRDLQDLRASEWVPLLILSFIILYVGIHPAPLFQWMEASR